MTSVPGTLPYINVRNLVVFPGMETCLVIGRAASISAIEAALASEAKHLLVVSQKQSQEDEVGDLSQMYLVGTVCKIERAVRMDDAMKIFISSQHRFKIDSVREEKGVRVATGVQIAEQPNTTEPSPADCRDVVALLRSWCKVMRNDAGEGDLAALLQPMRMPTYITKAAAITALYSIDSLEPDRNIIAAAKKGLGASYLESFERNKEAINLLVAGRQRLLEEVDSRAAVQVLKDLLKWELSVFAPAGSP